MSPLAIACDSLHRLQLIRRECAKMAPDRLATIDAAIGFFVKVVALLSRVPEPGPWDVVLIETWCARSNEMLEAFLGGVN